MGQAMTTEQQALADMPIWLLIVLSMIGGVSGEMWRADKDGGEAGHQAALGVALRCLCRVRAVDDDAASRQRRFALGKSSALGRLTAMAGVMWPSGFMSVGL